VGLTYRRVQDTTMGCHLTIGVFPPFGVRIDSCFGNNGKRYGVAVLRKL
jgi:hypothetical protein